MSGSWPGEAPCTLVAGDLEAVFLPDRGMLGASLRHRGRELLGRVEDLEAAAAKGSSAGIPLLHPWANRLASLQYHAAGRDVGLDPASPLLHFDAKGLPIHGVPWAQLGWEPILVAADSVTARLDWNDDGRLAIFPFPHRLEMSASLDAEGLTVETTLIAGSDAPVPISFGFHPYFTLPDLPRSQWRLSMPPMQRLVADSRGIPTGARQPFAAMDRELGDLDLDDGFALQQEAASFSLSGGGRRILVEFLRGYGYAQIFAPAGKDFVAVEPMTAETNALISGRGPAALAASGRYETAFRVEVHALS